MRYPFIALFIALLFAKAHAAGGTAISLRYAHDDRVVEVTDVTATEVRGRDGETIITLPLGGRWEIVASGSVFDYAAGSPRQMLRAYPQTGHTTAPPMLDPGWSFRRPESGLNAGDVLVRAWVFDGAIQSVWPSLVPEDPSEMRLHSLYRGEERIPPSQRDGYGIEFAFRAGRFLAPKPSPSNIASARWLAPEEAIERLAKVGASKADRYAIIKEAASAGNLDLLRELIEQPPPFLGTPTRDDLVEALSFALLNGRIATAEYLMQRNIKIPNGRLDAFGLAASSGHLDTIQFLIKNKGSRKFPSYDKENSPIAIAIMSKNWDVADLLVSSGMRPAANKDDSSEIARNAVAKRNPSLAAKMWRNGTADPLYSTSGDNAFYVAAGYADVSQLELLKSFGMPICPVNTRGFTPLHIACIGENFEAIQWFLDQGVHKSAEFAKARKLMQRTIEFNKPGSIKLLVENGFDPNEVLPNGNSLLMESIFVGSFDAAEQLLQLGARADALTDETLEDALVTILRADRARLLEMLAERGAASRGSLPSGWDLATVAHKLKAELCAERVAAWPPPTETKQLAPNPEVTTQPKLVHLVLPRYDFRHQDRFGDLNVEVAGIIDIDGQFRFASLDSSVDPILAEPAIRSAEQWVFEPARRGTDPVAIAAAIQVPFRRDGLALDNSPLDERPVLIHYEAPELQAGMEGYAIEPVVVRLQIDTNGIPADVETANPAHDSPALECAVEAVRKWRFIPAMKDGKPTLVGLTLTVSFDEPHPMPFPELNALRDGRNANSP